MKKIKNDFLGGLHYGSEATLACIAFGTLVGVGVGSVVFISIFMGLVPVTVTPKNKEATK